MGAQLCSEPNAMEPREALRFHDKAKGAQVRLDAQGCRASRCATFHDGIVFSQRPVRPSEQVVLRVLQHEDRWCGGLRVGFTRLDPERLSAASLPPFVCPDLVEQSPTWAAVLPEGSALAGDLVRFWVDPRGRLFAKTNEGPGFLLRKDVLMGAPLWAVMDVYGTTKAIELLDPTAGWCPTAMPEAPWEEALPEHEGWIEAFSTRTEKAHEVLKALLKDIMPRFGLPRSLQSDNGPSFISKITQQNPAAPENNDDHAGDTEDGGD